MLCSCVVQHQEANVELVLCVILNKVFPCISYRLEHLCGKALSCNNGGFRVQSFLRILLRKN